MIGCHGISTEQGHGGAQLSLLGQRIFHCLPQSTCQLGTAPKSKTDTAKPVPKHSKTIHIVVKVFSCLILCCISEAEGCVERKGISKDRAIPEGTAGSSSGCSLGSKPLPRRRELLWGKRAWRDTRSASCRRDFSCVFSSLFLLGNGLRNGQLRALDQGSSAWPRAGAPGVTAGGSTSPQL